ncbi:MAG: methylmalonyl-CoA mutase family protein, partial [bacterium]
MEEVVLTDSGLPLKPLYRPEDVAGLDYERDLGDPGTLPYTRGVYPEMYRRRLWTIRPLAGFATAEDTNRRCRWLLAHGATGVNVTVDYSTLRGYDSIDPIAAGDAGLGGVIIDCADDAAALVDGIDIAHVSVSLVTCNPIAAMCVFPMYLAAARRRNIQWSDLGGTTQNDFLMETVITTSPTVLPPAASFRLSCDVVQFCARHVPRWHPISFAGYNYREAGATAIQEGALVLAHALAVSREMMRRDVEAHRFLPRLSFFLAAGNDFFEEIAKFRALRKIWARMVAEELGVEDGRCRQFRFHVQTSGAALTRQQPLNNVVRAAYHGMAAVLGGAQSLHLSGYDEVFGLPSEQAAELAVRTQQILALETNVAATADPLAGSYYVESLTREIEERVLDYVRRVEGLGGIVRAVESGWVHRELADSG